MHTRTKAFWGIMFLLGFLVLVCTGSRWVFHAYGPKDDAKHLNTHAARFIDSMTTTGTWPTQLTGKSRDFWERPYRVFQSRKTGTKIAVALIGRGPNGQQDTEVSALFAGMRNGDDIVVVIENNGGGNFAYRTVEGN